MVKRFLARILRRIRVSFSGHRADTQLSHQSQDGFVIYVDPILPLESELEPPVAVAAATCQVIFLNEFQPREIRIWLSESLCFPAWVSSRIDSACLQTWPPLPFCTI
jgi:hypothetical protein